VSFSNEINIVRSHQGETENGNIDKVLGNRELEEMEKLEKQSNAKLCTDF
jgi:hypothetical protein